jgi:hypothetical protein
VCLLYNAETMSVEKARLDSHVFPAIAEAYESPFLQPWGPNTRLFVRARLFPRATTIHSLLSRALCGPISIVFSWCLLLSPLQVVGQLPTSPCLLLSPLQVVGQLFV